MMPGKPADYAACARISQIAFDRTINHDIMSMFERAGDKWPGATSEYPSDSWLTSFWPHICAPTNEVEIDETAHTLYIEHVTEPAIRGPRELFQVFLLG